MIMGSQGIKDVVNGVRSPSNGEENAWWEEELDERSSSCGSGS